MKQSKFMQKKTTILAIFSFIFISCGIMGLPFIAMALDAIAPETTITVMPAKTSTSADASFSFTSNEPGTFQCKLDGGIYELCVSPKIYSSLTEGSHTFYVKAIDSAGNMDVSPAVYFWTIAIAPETTITVMPAKTSTSVSASFSFTSNEPGTFQCKLDSLTYTVCTSPKIYDVLNPGTHTFYVKAIDSAGNMDVSPAVYAWTIIDVMAPETTITAMPAKTSTSVSASFSFTSNEPGIFQCKLDGGTYAVCASPKTYSNLAYGSHTFYVKAIDNANNMDVSPAVYFWTIIDAVAPETSITITPAKTATTTSASFSFTSNEPGTFQCKLDGGTYAVCSSPKIYSTLAYGSHTFYVKAIDSAGNMDVSPAVYFWTIIDIVAPETTITVMPAKTAITTSASFSFTSNEAGTFQCKLDGGTYAVCTSPKTYSNLAYGSHTFYVKAIDNANNMDVSPAVYFWTIIDAVAPETTITVMPSKISTSFNPYFRFTSNEAGTFQCKLDGGNYTPCVSPITYSALNTGAHTFYVRAIDSAGNIDATPAVYDWDILDTVKPQTTITGMPAKISTSTTAIFIFESNEEGTFQCKLDSEIYAPCTSPKIYTELTERTHTFYVKAKDNAGNVDDVSPAYYTWTIAIAPETTITLMPPKISTSTSAKFSFISNETGTFQCKLDGGTYASCYSPKTYSSLSEGSHTFYVKAIDSKGNMDVSPAVYFWTIATDIIAPETTITDMPSKNSTSTEASFSFISNEPGTFQCKLDGGTYALCTSPKIFNSLSEGSHTFYVKAIDNAGNMDVSPAVYFWTIATDVIAPETTITVMPAKTSTSADASFSFTSNEPGTFQCKLDGGIYELCVSPKIYSSLTEGSHTFYVKAIDSAGNMDVSPAVYFWTIATDIITPETTTTDMSVMTLENTDVVLSLPQTSPELSDTSLKTIPSNSASHKKTKDR